MGIDDITDDVTVVCYNYTTSSISGGTLNNVSRNSRGVYADGG